MWHWGTCGWWIWWDGLGLGWVILGGFSNLYNSVVQWLCSTLSVPVLHELLPDTARACIEVEVAGHELSAQPLPRKVIAVSFWITCWKRARIQRTAASCGSGELTEGIGWVISLPLRTAMSFWGCSLTVAEAAFCTIFDLFGCSGGTLNFIGYTLLYIHLCAELVIIYEQHLAYSACPHSKD